MQQYKRWLIQATSALEFAIHTPLSKIPLYNTAMNSSGVADNDVPKTYVVFHAPHPTTNTDHKAETYWEAVLHTLCDSCSRAISCHASGEASDNDVVNADPAKCVSVFIVFLLSLSQDRVGFVQHGDHSSRLCCQGAYNTDSVVIVRSRT